MVKQCGVSVVVFLSTHSEMKRKSTCVKELSHHLKPRVPCTAVDLFRDRNGHTLFKCLPLDVCALVDLYLPKSTRILNGEFTPASKLEDVRCRMCADRKAAWVEPGGTFNHLRYYCYPCLDKRLTKRDKIQDKEFAHAKDWVDTPVRDRYARYGGEQIIIRNGMNARLTVFDAKCWECGADFLSSGAVPTPRCLITNLSERSFCADCTIKYRIKTDVCCFCGTVTNKDTHMTFLRKTKLHICEECLHNRIFVSQGACE